MIAKSRAAVVPKPSAKLEIREFKVPELVPGSALFKVANAGVCGTDVHLWHGKLSGVPYPLILGHEVVGTIEEVGPKPIKSLDGDQIQRGDRVVFHDVTDTCYACWNCLVAKAPTKCTNRTVYGITKDPSKWPYLVGAYSEYMYLTPGTHIIKLPDNVSFDGASALGCAMPTAVAAANRSPIKFGSNVVIQGAGPVGLMMAIVASVSGAATVTTIDQAPNRLALAKRFGATHTLNFKETTLDDRKKFLRDITYNHGPDMVFEATGSALAISEGIELVREGGTYTISGQYTDSGKVEVSPHLMNRKHLEIRTVWGTETTHVYQGIKLVGRHYSEFPFEDLVTHRFPLDDAQKALETQESLKSVKAVIKP